MRGVHAVATSMRITFHSNQLSERGTEVALYDYAFFNEVVLGNESFIVSSGSGDLSTLDKFRRRFPVQLYEDPSELETLLERSQADALYAIKYGLDDGLLGRNCKNLIHAVFDPTHPHGDVYAAVSQWLSEAKTGGRIPFVPHMIHLPDTRADLREELSIPPKAVVLGRYGGYDQFDIPFVHHVVDKIAREETGIYFLFMNTCPFTDPHERIIHLPKNVNLTYKTAFINTCNAMLHARRQGETFGLAIGEFSIRDRPVLTWTRSSDKSHLQILGGKALAYSSEQDLESIIRGLGGLEGGHWDAYSREFSPEPVMERFRRVFLDERPPVEGR